MNSWTAVVRSPTVLVSKAAALIVIGMFGTSTSLLSTSKPAGASNWPLSEYQSKATVTKSMPAAARASNSCRLLFGRISAPSLAAAAAIGLVRGELRVAHSPLSDRADMREQTSFVAHVFALLLGSSLRETPPAGRIVEAG
jgi:hypothetical protein